MSEYTFVLVSTILGCLFWLAIIIALVLLVVGHSAMDRVFRDDDEGDPNE